MRKSNGFLILYIRIKIVLQCSTEKNISIRIKSSFYYENLLFKSTESKVYLT